MKILSFDSTGLNNNSATGNFKINIFSKDIKNEYLFISTKQIKHLKKIIVENRDGNLNVFSNYGSLRKKINLFNPELAILRIDFDQVKLMKIFIKYFNETNIPYVLIIYDSWFNNKLAKKNLSIFLKLLKNSSGLITEIKDLSLEIVEKFKYEKNILEIRNSWYKNKLVLSNSKAVKSPKIIFSGNINKKINYSSLLKFALALEKSHLDIDLHIFKHPLHSKIEKKFFNLTKTYIFDQVGYESFFKNLQNYDFGFVPYSFDEKAERYSKNSFSNKLHQYLYNGLSPIGFGPINQVTIKFLIENNFKNVLTVDNQNEVINMLSNLKYDDTRTIQKTVSNFFDLELMHYELNNYYQNLDNNFLDNKIQLPNVRYSVYDFLNLMFGYFLILKNKFTGKINSFFK